MSKYQWTVIALAVLINIMLYAKDGKISRNAIGAGILLIILSFFVPLFAMVMIIPITFIVYQNSYKTLGSFYDRAKNIQFVSNS